MVGRFVKFARVAAALSLFTACGGETSSGGNCGGSPCGGNVVGKWSIVQSCVVPGTRTSSSDLPPECAGAIQSTGATSTGSYEFRSDGTMYIDVAASGTVTESLSDACMAAIGAPGTPTQACSDLDAEFRRLSDPSQAAPGDVVFQSASCSYTPGRCVCRATVGGPSLQAASTYTVSANQLINSSGEPIGYCVEGDTLKLFLIPSASSSSTGTIVLDRVN